MKYHDVRHRFDYECDELGCFSALCYEDRFGSQSAANTEARKDGWSVGKRDLCPKHRCSTTGLVTSKLPKEPPP